MDDVSLPADEPFLSSLCVWFNLLSGFAEDPQWRKALKSQVIAKYPASLTQDELKDSFDILSNLNVRMVKKKKKKIENYFLFF